MRKAAVRECGRQRTLRDSGGSEPAWRPGRLQWLLAFLLLGAVTAAACRGQEDGGWAGGAAQVSAAAPGGGAAAPHRSQAGIEADVELRWAGLPVTRISFAGIPADRLRPLAGHLAQAAGKPLSPVALRESLRRLYATGLYDTIEAEGAREGDGVALVFRGRPRMFIGTVSVDGAKGATVNAQLERASELTPGTRFTEAKLARAVTQMRAALADNGFPDPAIEQKLTQHEAEQLVDIAFHVSSGAQARVGAVEVSGDSGMTAGEFRRRAHLRRGAHVDHDTVDHALDSVLEHYQKQGRLEADVKLAGERYEASSKQAEFSFTANRGPVVRVRVEGASLDAGPGAAAHPDLSGRKRG